MTKAAFGLSIKAGAGRRAPQGRPAPPQKEPGGPRSLLLSCCRGPLCPQQLCSRWLSASPGLVESARAWEGWGTGRVLQVMATPPHRALGEDGVNEQLTRQEHAEQEPGAGALHEAWGWRLPGPHRGAQHGREVPARTGYRGSARLARQEDTPCFPAGTVGQVVGVLRGGSPGESSCTDTHSREKGSGLGSWASCIPPPTPAVMGSCVPQTHTVEP